MPISEADVAIVGYGPVGQVLAALLGMRGHRIVVLERHPDLYGLPRAGHLDHEVMRVLQGVGCASALLARAAVATNLDWVDRRGRLLVRVNRSYEAPSGWPSDIYFFQPDLERLIDGAVRRSANVRVKHGTEVVAVRRAGESFTLTAHSEEGASTYSARILVGADGAGSFVRTWLGHRMEDLGFSADYLVVDLEQTAPTRFDFTNRQVCDPRRPHYVGRLGGPYRRFEFQVLPGEDAEAMLAEGLVRDLLPTDVNDANTRLVRQTAYRFRSLLARTWHSDGCLLVGDAAHLMPPFLGQGLCSGIRDAVNAAWKIDLVLRGEASVALLDTVAAERRPQVRWITERAIELGRIVCETDPQLAQARDAALLLRRRIDGDHADDGLAIPGLVGGIVASGSTLAGQLSVQGTLRTKARAGRSDDILFGSAIRGWQLIGRSAAATNALDPPARSFLKRLGTAIVDLGEPSVEDLNGLMTGWLDEHGVTAVLVRPDFYVYGSASTPADVQALVRSLEQDLTVS